MIKKYHIIGILFLIIFLSYYKPAYSKDADTSIEIRYKLSTQPDSVLFRMLHDSVWFYFDRDLNKVKDILPYYKKYLDLKGSYANRVDYYTVLGTYYNYLNLNDSAILYMEEAIDMMNSKSNTFIGKRDYIYNRPSMYNNIALIYDDMGMYESAVEFQLKSINAIKEIRFRDTLNKKINSLLISDYVELAMMYSNFEDTTNAKSYFLEGIKLSKANNDEYLKAYSALNYGVYLSYIEEYDSALININNSKIYYNLKGNAYNNIVIDLNISKIFAKQGNIEKAISITDSIYKVTDDLGFDALKLASLEILFYFNYNNNYNLKNAIFYGSKYLELANSQNRRIGSIKILSNLANIYVSKNQYKKAYLYLSKSKSISDSINNIDHIANAKILESKYKLIQRNTENEVLVRENKIKDEYIKKSHKTRRIIISLLVISILFGIILLFSFKRIKKINLKLKTSNKSLEHKSIELAQYNSALEKVFGIFTHDLKGPIGTADMFFRMLEDDNNSITEEKKGEYIKLIGKSMKVTFSMLENLLYWSKHRIDNKISIKEFSISNLINNILENIKLTLFTKGISFKNNIDNSILVKSDENYLRIIFRNIISNAVKFTPDNGEIIINYVKKESKHYIYITDNGVGMTKEQTKNLFKTKNPISNLGTNNEKGTGIGLLISLELIKSLGGRIDIKSKIGEGSTFIITLAAN